MTKNVLLWVSIQELDGLVTVSKDTGDIVRKRGPESAAEDLVIRDTLRAKRITTAQEVAGYCSYFQK